MPACCRSAFATCCGPRGGIGPSAFWVRDVPGDEAFDLFQALNTSSLGTLSTIHANSAEQALHRFTSSMLQSRVDLSHPAIRPARVMLPPCPCIRRHGC